MKLYVDREVSIVDREVPIVDRGANRRSRGDKGRRSALQQEFNSMATPPRRKEIMCPQLYPSANYSWGHLGRH